MTTPRQYLLQAYQEATKSPDPSTQNGAVIVTHDGVVVYDHNRFPDRVKLSDERLVRPLKYEFIEHAERNVIYKCARLGLPTAGATMYVPWFACSDCARGIIQAGIAHVVGHQRMADDTPDRWKDSIGAATTMFKEAGLKITMIPDKLDGPRILFNGNWWIP